MRKPLKCDFTGCKEIVQWVQEV